jgi:hypothetical protein
MRFSDALDRSLEEIKRPPNLPIGHYIWQIEKHPDMDEFTSSRTGDPFERITFNLICAGASDDVDTDLLAEYGNPAGARNRKTFMFSNNEEEKASFDRSMFNLRRFLGHCGVDEGLSIGEALAASVGQQFLGELTHRPDPNDTEIIYTEIGKTAEV